MKQLGVEKPIYTSKNDKISNEILFFLQSSLQ